MTVSLRLHHRARHSDRSSACCAPRRFPAAVRFGNVYVELFRNVPLLVQMFLWYFVLPELRAARCWPTGMKQLPNASFYTAVVALGLYMSARDRRAGARRNVEPAARPAAGLAGARADAAADLRVCAAADDLSHHACRRSPRNCSIPSRTARWRSPSVLMELTARARAMQEFSFQVFEAFTAATDHLHRHQHRRDLRHARSSSAASRFQAISVSKRQLRGIEAMFF